MIKAVVFELDGVLAKTISTPELRTAWSVLSPGYDDSVDWRWSQDVCDTPGILIARGYRVFVIGPTLSYTSTLMHLIGADYDANLSIAGELRSRWNLGPGEVAYVSDRNGVETARAASVKHFNLDQLKDGTILDELPRLSYEAGSSSALKELFAQPQSTPGALCGMYFFMLRDQPGSLERRDWQIALFQSLEPSVANCIIEYSGGLFRFPPFLVTKTELRKDAELRQQYLAGVRRLFPTMKFRFSPDRRYPENAIPVRFAQYYASRNERDPKYGNVMSQVKDYGLHRSEWRSGSFVYRSGPMVYLGMLDLVADIMAAAGDDDFGGAQLLVPVEASPPSDSRPGEVSLRLAQLIADRSNRSVLSVLNRTADGVSIDKRSAQRTPVILVDDQMTTGKTVRDSIKALQSAGYRVCGIFVFSAKRKLVAEHGSPIETDTPDCGFGGVAESLGLNCQCGR